MRNNGNCNKISITVRVNWFNVLITHFFDKIRHYYRDFDTLSMRDRLLCFICYSSYGRIENVACFLGAFFG